MSRREEDRVEEGVERGLVHGKDEGLLDAGKDTYESIGRERKVTVMMSMTRGVRPSRRVHRDGLGWCESREELHVGGTDEFEFCDEVDFTENEYEAKVSEFRMHACPPGSLLRMEQLSWAEGCGRGLDPLPFVR